MDPPDYPTGSRFTLPRTQSQLSFHSQGIFATFVIAFDDIVLAVTQRLVESPGFDVGRPHFQRDDEHPSGDGTRLQPAHQLATDGVALAGRQYTEQVQVRRVLPELHDGESDQAPA